MPPVPLVVVADRQHLQPAVVSEGFDGIVHGTLRNAVKWRIGVVFPDQMPREGQLHRTDGLHLGPA
ncbi:hypothetical protein D3C75_1199360 [compost metagenome]